MNREAFRLAPMTVGAAVTDLRPGRIDELPAALKTPIADLEFKASFRPDRNTETYPGTLWTSARVATPAEYPPNEQLVPAFEASVAVAQQLPPMVHRAVTRRRAQRTTLAGPLDAGRPYDPALDGGGPRAPSPVPVA
jgi:hypothetical protein